MDDALLFMTQSLTIAEFLTASGSLLDVRSPGEYQQGHIPGAISFPLFTDAERAQVGICYKQQGRDQAVELGFAIAGPKFVDFIVKAKAIAPERRVRVHCWRGGMRSSAVAWVLEMAGFQVTTLTGGYKAFRRWVREVCAIPRPIITLGGMTGTGKTVMLHALAQQGEQVLDLEAIAHHRGSSFGALGLPPQPSNEQFENLVAMHWANFQGDRPVWIEAESRRIGLCRVPQELFQHMMAAPVLEIVRSRQERLQHLVEEYGQFSTDDLVLATQRIHKRLGGVRTQTAIALLQERRLMEAFDIILAYYDKTYRYDLERRQVAVMPVDLQGCSHPEGTTRLLTAAQTLTATRTAPLPLAP
jgi:tRNA 2-selenouridine synthase